MASGYDGSVRIDTTLNAKNFNSGIKAMTGAVRGLAAAIGVAFGVGAIVNFGKTAVATAGQLAAAMTGLQSVLSGTGKSFAAGKQFIDAYISDGLVPATDAIVAYKNLALRGYDTGQIEKVMTALKDSAAFGRQSSLSLGQAVQSATEGLKNENSILVDNAGVTKNVAKMWDDYAKSIGTTAANLNKQQKIQAEVNGILEESRYQTGDAAKLAGGYAGRVAALSTSFYNLRVAIGNAIIPVLTKIMPVIKAAVDQLVIFFNRVAQFMSLLFGVELGGATTEAMGAVAESTEGAADAQQDLADATTKAGKAARGALAAFDQLDVLQRDEGAAAAAGAPDMPVIAPIVDTGGIDKGLDETKKKVEAFKSRLMELFGPASAAFGRLKDALGGLGKTIWEGLQWAWENILVPLGKWVIQDALPVFLDLLAARVEVVNEALIALQPLAKWLWEKFLKPAAEWTGQAILNGLTWLTERLKDLSKWIRDNPEKFQAIIAVIGVLVASLWLAGLAIQVWAAGMAIASGVAGAFAAVTALLSSGVLIVAAVIAILIVAIILLVKHWDQVKETAGEVWEKVKEIWAPVGAWFAENVTGPLGEKFGGLFETLKVHGKQFYEGFIKPMAEWFMTYLWPIIQRFMALFLANFKAGFDTAVSIFKNVFVVLADIIGGIVDLLGGLIKFITGVFTGNWRLAWEGVRQVFKGVFDGLAGIVRGVVNTVIDLVNFMIRAVVNGINAVIDSMGSVQIEIPWWVPGFGGSSWGLYMPHIGAPSIPRLASGAVIPPNSEFAAILGDQRSGRNIETPEALMRQIVREEVGKVQADISIGFNGSLGALVRELKPMIDKENVRIGGSLVNSGSIA